MRTPATKRWKSAAAALYLTLLLSPLSAWAYADPGTGAFLVQALAAAFFGVMFYFRKFVYRFFRKPEAGKDGPSPPVTPE